MEYPKDPTVLPSAQRHTETYNADQGRVFTDGDVISIQIPPTSNSYLTKDIQLHFDFDMTYQEGTDDDYKEIIRNLNLASDSNKYIVADGSNSITFTGGYAETLSVTAKTYDSLNDLCEQFNEDNSAKPIRLYYDSIKNDVFLMYGLLIKTNDNDVFEYSVEDIEQEKITITPEVYSATKLFPNVPVYSIVNYFNWASGIVDLNYDHTSKKFSFTSMYPFTINPASDKFLISLGFSQANGQSIIASAPVSPSTKYTITAASFFPETTKSDITITSTPFGIQLGFAGPLILANADATDTGTRYREGTSKTIKVPFSEAEPQFFFTNILHKETDSAVAVNQTYPNIYRPYPTLDVNGPYSFFESIEVYDYLGNTLLEKIPRHDLLTAIWSDLQSSTEDENTIIRSDQLDEDLLSITKPPCSYLVTGDPRSLYTVYPVTDIYATDTTVKAATLTVPTLSCGINLYSFLGKLSDKFVPLHNGFTVKFFINRRENVVAFNTQQPGNVISYNAIPQLSLGPPETKDTPVEHSTTMHPSIKTYTFSNVYLRGDIITVPPELDSRIDKIVFAKGYKIQSGIPQNRAQRVNTDVKSLTSLVVVQQPGYSSTNTGSIRQSAFIRNYCPGAKLLYNKAVVSSVKNFTEAYRNFRNVFGCVWDKYVRRVNWEVDEPSSDAAWMQTRMIDKNNLGAVSDAGQDLFFQDVSVPLGSLPRYLLAFDTRLPGYTPMAVCGIDTRKQLLEVQLETTTSTKQSAVVTMISEFDTFIEIKPSESTAVSF